MKPAELRLVFVSDIHLSFDNLRKISEFAGSSNLKFDYCLVGGDIANCQPDDSP